MGVPVAIVFIPAQLQSLTNGIRSVEVSATTVREVVLALESRFPGIRERLCDGDELTASLQVSIDDTLSTRGMRAEVLPKSEVHFLPALGGG
jgi:molybdopterin synthase sulfur carrier subunit